MTVKIMDLNLKNKTVLVTGSTLGIGNRIAETFLREGARILINGRDEEKITREKNRLIRQFGEDRVFAFTGDMTELGKIKACQKYVHDIWGHLDILVPCLGTGKAVSDERLDLMEWEHMMRCNLYASIDLIREFTPLLEKGDEANIVLISSVVAYERANAPYAYAAAKRAVLALCGYMAEDYAHKKIRVNCVVPGNVFFEGGRWEELQKADPEGTKRYVKENVPMCRFGRPEEIADAVVFLASARSSFTTGAALVVDGGQKRSI